MIKGEGSQGIWGEAEGLGKQNENLSSPPLLVRGWWYWGTFPAKPPGLRNRERERELLD